MKNVNESKIALEDTKNSEILLFYYCGMETLSVSWRKSSGLTLVREFCERFLVERRETQTHQSLITHHGDCVQECRWRQSHRQGFFEYPERSSPQAKRGGDGALY